MGDDYRKIKIKQCLLWLISEFPVLEWGKHLASIYWIESNSEMQYELLNPSL